MPHAGNGNPRDTRAVAMEPNKGIRNPGQRGVQQSSADRAMANEAPAASLALSDIMHTESPSPDPEDMQSYRNKIAEMGLETPRERELGDMVLSLLDGRRWDPGQLVEQAGTISGLMQEREMMGGLFAEERARWEVERDGWERSAEALIAQRIKENPDVFKTEQITYFNSLLESDNKVKTEKLQEALARLSSLEAELAKLKPILLLQPFPSSARPSHSALVNASTYLSSLPYPAATGDSALVAQKQRGAKKKKDKVPPPAHGSDEDNPVPAEPGAALVDPPPNINGQTSYVSAAQDSTTGSPQYRFAVDVYAHLRPKNAQSPGQTIYSKKGRPARAKETKPPTTLSSDARTEHILLAARKIGRERATVVSSVTQAERMAREQERLEKERAKPSTSHYRAVTSPRTPKRAPAASGSNHYLHVGGSGYPYSPSPGAGLFLTPQARQVARPSPAAGSSKNPPTPLDSLVDVALNMAGDSPPRSRRRRAASPESPSQKRRRTGTQSALDVLADQAAAYGKEEGRPRRTRLAKVAAPRVISPAPRVIERVEEPPDADVDADGDSDPDVAALDASNG